MPVNLSSLPLPQWLPNHVCREWGQDEVRLRTGAAGRALCRTEPCVPIPAETPLYLSKKPCHVASAQRHSCKSVIWHC